ncbi:MAG: hypothetical protein ACREJ2_18275 [Planctomycetota bacterium]
MIAYMCDLHREGVQTGNQEKQAPLNSFLGALNCPVPKQANARREWNSIDLAIHDDLDNRYQVLFEMKVDDNEHETVDSKSKKRFWQTVYYANKFPKSSACRFVTLGFGEYHRGPYSEEFKWVKIRNFMTALSAVKTDDIAIRTWREAIKNEILLQERVRKNDRSDLHAILGRTDERPTRWNMYFLGLLKEELENRNSVDWKQLVPRCYTRGSKPDTILHFEKVGYEYLEINDNGYLNWKIYLDHLKTPKEKEMAITEATERVRKMNLSERSRAGLEIPENRRFGRTKTIAKIEIGLRKKEGVFDFCHVSSRNESNRDDVINRILEVITPFYKRGQSCQ